ncbi:MAG: alpha/beta fold hydrolase [Myxococcota bacterium]
MAITTLRHHPHNDDGWSLDLKQTWDTERFDPERHPIAIIPGYGMNAFVLGYHPNGLSLEAYLAQSGFEVWSLNLRGQGAARRHYGSPNYGFRQLALIDLPCAFAAIRRHSHSQASQQLNLIGCSLGATLMYIYAAHHPTDHHLVRWVTIGGPLRWDNAHPLMRLAFRSPALAGALPIRGTRALARTVLPIAKRLPQLLSLYMNANIIDLTHADQLVQTVDNPNRRLNRQIALWMRDRDLVVAGLDITQALAGIDLPLLCILANKDGIVPPQAVLSVCDAIGTQDVTVLKVGDERTWFAHADLFISRYAQERVFEPLVQWLNRP